MDTKHTNDAGNVQHHTTSGINYALCGSNRGKNRIKVVMVNQSFCLVHVMYKLAMNKLEERREEQESKGERVK